MIFRPKSKGKEKKVRKGKVKINIVERGPIRIVLEVKEKGGEIDRVQRIILYSQLRRIEFETEVYFKGRDKRVKVVFKPRRGGITTYETPFSKTQRKDGHWCAENWVELSDGTYSFALINSGNPGYEVNENLISMTLFRSVSILPPKLILFIMKNLSDLKDKALSAIKIMLKGLNVSEMIMYPYHGLILREWASEGGPELKGGWTFFDHIIPYLKFWKPSDAWERGHHMFRYAVYAHSADVDNVVNVGYEFNHPLIVKKTLQRKGVLPNECSFIKIEPDSAVLSCLKKAEDGGKLVARVYNSSNKDVDVNFEFFLEIKRLLKGSMTEDEIYEDIPHEYNKFKCFFKKYEISTFMFEC